MVCAICASSVINNKFKGSEIVISKGPVSFRKSCCINTENGDQTSQEMQVKWIRILMLLVTLNIVASDSKKEEGFLQRIHSIAKRLDGAMKDRANEIKSRTNQTVETPPDVMSKMWEYLKTNTNDPPMGRLMADVTKLAAAQESMLAALGSMGACHTEVGERHCANTKALLASLNLHNKPTH